MQTHPHTSPARPRHIWGNPPKLRPLVSGRRIASDAFGQAIGSSIAEASWSSGVLDTTREDFRRSEIEAMNADTLAANSPYSLAYGTSSNTGFKPYGRTGLQVKDIAYAEWSEGVDSGIRQAAAYLTPDDLIASFDLGSAQDKWMQTGQKPVYDFGDPFVAGNDGDLLAAGPRRTANRPFQLARNPNGEAKSQLISDPWGLFGPGWAGEYSGLSETAQRYGIKQEIDEIRARLGQGGRNIPDVPKAWVNGGQLVDDYSPSQLERFRTVDNLEMLRKQGIVELDADWGIKSVVSGREMFIKPSQVRFTQEWVSYTSSDKVNTLDTTGRTARIAPEQLPARDVVVMPDGRLTSLDNRRLTAAQLHNAESVKVVIHDSNDMLPNADTVKRFTWDGNKPTTWSEAAAVRIFKQGADFRESFRQGSPVVPQVRQAPEDPLYRPYLITPTRRR